MAPITPPIVVKALKKEPALLFGVAQVFRYELIAGPWHPIPLEEQDLEDEDDDNNLITFRRLTPQNRLVATVGIQGDRGAWEYHWATSPPTYPEEDTPYFGSEHGFEVTLKEAMGEADQVLLDDGWTLTPSTEGW